MITVADKLAMTMQKDLMYGKDHAKLERLMTLKEFNKTQQGGMMRKKKVKTKESGTKISFEAEKKIWTELNRISKQVGFVAEILNEHKAKIHNLNGDTTTIFDKLAEKPQEPFYGLLIKRESLVPFLAGIALVLLVLAVK